MPRSSRVRLSLAVAATLGLPCAAQAVYLNPDGLGQALIYPYYTVRSVNGNAFNTLVSVVNHTPRSKVVRVRFLEGLNARAVQGFNLYLSPNDVWTGAVVPLGADSTRVVSADTSCTNGVFDNSELGLPGRTFQNVFYAGSNTDGFGEGLDRTREGYIEMIEMATVTGVSAAAVIHTALGVPHDCPSVQGTPVLQLDPPSGGLSGTLTLINVNNGSDFTVNAEALADLTTQPFYRPPADPYPGFDAAEVTPVSTVVANGQIYRSVWTRGIDAVSAVFMRSALLAEFVLDANTHSRTDFGITFPTRRYYPAGGSAATPFDAAGTDPFAISYFNRDERVASAPGCTDYSGAFICGIAWQSPVSVLTLSNGSAHTTSGVGVLGSKVGPRYSASFGSPVPEGPIRIVTGFSNGWLAVVPIGSSALAPGLNSLAASQRIDSATGAVAAGTHGYAGLPITGFMLRTFENGTLACGAGACQGNYGGSFPFKYRRQITP